MNVSLLPEGTGCTWRAPACRTKSRYKVGVLVKTLDWKRKKRVRKYADFLWHSRKLEILKNLTLVALQVRVWVSKKTLNLYKTENTFMQTLKQWRQWLSWSFVYDLRTICTSVPCELRCVICSVLLDIILLTGSTLLRITWVFKDIMSESYWRSAAYASFSTQQFLCAFLYSNFLYCEWDISAERVSNGWPLLIQKTSDKKQHVALVKGQRRKQGENRTKWVKSWILHL